MMNAEMSALTMPKWGLSMTKGKIVGWLVDENSEVTPGTPVVDIETEKILSSLEAAIGGVLRRKVAQEGDVVAVGNLLGVIASPSVSDSDLDRFVEDFHSHYTPDNSRDQPADAMTETIDVGGHRISYVRRGEGEVSAILLHGFGGDLNTWMFNHDALALRHSVYALDLPGHGNSSKQVGKRAFSELVETLNGFIERLGIESAHLVGHSMGGAVAIEFARCHPARCRSLTLIASAALGPEIDGEYIQAFVSATRRNDLKRQMEKLFADSRLITRQLVEDTLKRKRLDGAESALRAIASQLWQSGGAPVVLREQLAELKMPVLVLWGSEDRILPPSLALNLPRGISTEILAGYGHMLHMEAASRVNVTIASFWESSES